MPDNEPSVDLQRRTLSAVQRPARLRAIAEDVNDGRPGWDTISDRDVAKILCELHEQGLVVQRVGGWWHRTMRGIIE